MTPQDGQVYLRMRLFRFLPAYSLGRLAVACKATLHIIVLEHTPSTSLSHACTAQCTTVRLRNSYGEGVGKHLSGWDMSETGTSFGTYTRQGAGRGLMGRHNGKHIPLRRLISCKAVRNIASSVGAPGQQEPMAWTIAAATQKSVELRSRYLHGSEFPVLRISEARCHHADRPHSCPPVGTVITELVRTIPEVECIIPPRINFITTPFHTVLTSRICSNSYSSSSSALPRSKATFHKV